MVLLKDSATYIRLLADSLSVVTITICFILKIPQIVNLLKVGNANGINMLGLVMELTSYTITMAYNFRNHYALLSYLEYPIILVQELILILVVMHYKKHLNIYGLVGAMLYFSIAGSLLLGIVPMGLLTFLVPLCTPIGASSKVVQLVEILKHKNAESVSVLTWFISAFTNFTRIFTIMVDSGDLTLLLNFSVNTILSTSIMLAAVVYKHPKID